MYRTGSDCIALLSLVTFLNTTNASEVEVVEDQPEDRTWSALVDIGFVRTGGNSDTESLKGKLEFVKSYDEWKHALQLEGLNSSSNDERSAEKYLANFQTDYAINEKSYTLAFATGEKDRFSGFEYQASLGLGYGYKIIQTDNLGLNFEVGAGYRMTELESGSNEEDAILRLAEKFFWQLGETSKLVQSLSTEAGEDNTVTRFGISLSSQIVGSLSMKIGYSLKHNSDVPEDTDNTDYETSATLAYEL